VHQSVMSWVQQQVAERDLANVPTLEVGSFNVNGSVRPFFKGSYVGIDMRPGPGVDQVLNAHDLGMVSNRFLCIVCCEMLEHDTEPWTSICEMAKVAGDGCILLVTCRGFDHRGSFPLHDFPDDVWRFTAIGLRSLLEHGGWEVISVEPDPTDPGVFAVGCIR